MDEGPKWSGERVTGLQSTVVSRKDKSLRQPYLSTLYRPKKGSYDTNTLSRYNKSHRQQ